MTAPAPTPAETAVIDRFGIFDEERVVEEVARAMAQTEYESVIDADAFEYAFDEIQRAGFRAYARAAIAAYRAQDGGAEEAVRRETGEIADTVLALADDFLIAYPPDDSVIEVDDVYDWLTAQAANLRAPQADR